MSRDKKRHTKSPTKKIREVLPDDIDRRTFTKSAVASLTLPALAGCLGDDDGNGGNGGSSPDSYTFSHHWDPDPDYAVPYVASENGFWEDAGADPVPDVNDGTGSGDNVRQIGNGEELFGHAGTEPQVTGFGEGLDFTVFGSVRARSPGGMMYRTDRMDSSTDVEGKDFATPSALVEQQFEVWVEGVADSSMDDIGSLDQIDTSTMIALFVEGDYDGMFQQIEQYPAIVQAMEQTGLDPELLDVDMLNNYYEVYGQTLIAHTPWIEDNIEYATSIVEGYSHATKWVMQNPREAVELMREENTALQTEDIEDQIPMIEVAIITMNLTEFTMEDGICWINEEQYGEAVQTMGEILGVDPAPTADDLVNMEPLENADLATLSQDEFDELADRVEEFLEWYDAV